MKDKLKDKMKKKFTDLSISHKMLMVYITFASAFLLIALGLTQISFRIYSKELYDKSLQELDYFSQNVNRGLKDAERNNYSISMDALVQRTLSDLSVLEYPSLDYNQKIRDLRRILLNEYDPESCVKSIIFVDLYGNTVEVGTAAWDVSGESFTAIKKQMEQGKGAYTTYGPTEECPYLLSGRVVRNRLDMSLSDMGKLIFVCDVGNVISENKESLSSNKAAIYVYNKNCAIYEDENIKKLDDLPKYVEHSGYKILKQSGRKYFVSYLYSAKTDWTYVSFFPYSDIYGQVQTVRTLLILGFLAVFTALVFFMKKLSVVIVSPLEHLTDSMQIVENGDFQGAREMLTNTDRQDEIGTLMERAKENGIMLTFDPNLRPALWNSVDHMIDVINKLSVSADVVLPGIGECEILLGTRNKEQIAAFYHSHGVKIVVIKDGKNGAFVSGKNGESTTQINVPGYRIEHVVDTVGAGDGFAVGFISGMLEGLPVEACAKRANAIGAIQVQHRGDNEGLPDRVKLEAAMLTMKQ